MASSARSVSEASTANLSLSEQRAISNLFESIGGGGAGARIAMPVLLQLMRGEEIMAGRVVGKVDSRGKPRVQTINTDPSMTVQSDAHLADIQNILKSFGQEGMAMLDEAELQFKDVSEFTDLRDALDQARIAEVQFMKLPSKVREIFQHDVAVWLDTAHDEDKRNELVQAGYLKDPKEVAPVAGTRILGGSGAETPEVTPEAGGSAGSE